MKKKIAFITLLALLLCNAAAAKYSDEYKAQYPKRVKVETRQLRSGQTYQKTIFKLFDKKLQTGRLKLDLELDNSGPDICFLTFSTYGSRDFGTIKDMSWGDGKEAHDIKIVSTSAVYSRGTFADLVIATVQPSKIKNAIVINAGINPIIGQTSKEWKEWQAAVNAADRLIKER